MVDGGSHHAVQESQSTIVKLSKARQGKTRHSRVRSDTISKTRTISIPTAIYTDDDIDKVNETENRLSKYRMISIPTTIYTDTDIVNVNETEKEYRKPE